MANELAKSLELMFEEFVEGYDAECVISQEAETTFPDPQDMQRAGDVFYTHQNYHFDVVTGLDISASASTDLIERFVPTVYRDPDNVKVTLDAKELRDDYHLKASGKGASTRLAAEIDKNLYAEVGKRATIVVDSSAAINWKDGSTAMALMASRGISSRDKKMFMNPFDYKDIGDELGDRAYRSDPNKSAYENAQVPDIATFRTFMTDNMYNLAGVGTVSGTTINGAQSHTVTAKDANDIPVDNRQMTLTVQGANVANIKVGDAFTIADVNAVHMIDKSDTGQLLTFRVLAVGGSGTSLTVSPALVSSGPYQNASQSAADGAAVTFLNTTTKPVNPFWAQGAVKIHYGQLAFPTDQGPKVMTARTKQGVPLCMSYDFNHLTGKTTARFHTLYAATVTDPEKVGIILPNQS